MPSGMKDSSPNMGKGRTTSDRSGGMKNHDGRIKGEGWDKENSPFGGQDMVSSFSDKKVGVMPNDELVELKKKGVIGQVIE